MTPLGKSNPDFAFDDCYGNVGVRCGVEQNQSGHAAGENRQQLCVGRREERPSTNGIKRCLFEM